MKALITGITGQDGSILAEQLLDAGYEVHGVIRGPRRERTIPNIEAFRERLTLHVDALDDPVGLLQAVAPDEVYHLGAPTFVPQSWEEPATTIEAIASVTAGLLDAIRRVNPAIRFVVAGSREMFGQARETPQTEATRCYPSSPYGVAKLAAFEIVRVLRHQHGLHAATAILYNHESTRRPEQFVTRRVTRGAAAIKLGLADKLTLGSLDAVRDWSAAGDVVRGMRMMLAAEQPADYILASGVGRTVGDLVDTAFGIVGLSPQGFVEADASLARVNEEFAAVGDPTKAREHLGWVPEVSFEELIAEMIACDLEQLRSSV